ncbi:conserved unknown protein [Ectocarpus siliculosus]|uniref:Uncharacterized protein n=1 Tax=Ectocarpus siliculosus TaxID=2880 RepID=D8LRC7_ECTSI|nr:conserved unknown protein [Ectocarpus siliculosus]|eukprot:CBN75032.1 conserved unknown protein [Ectocarpus siliculosus]
MFSNPQELRERAMRAQQGKKDDTTSLESKPSAEEASDEGAAAAAAAPAADAGVEEQQTPAAAGGKGGDEGEASPPLMTPEQVEEFFKSTMARLTSPEEREDIKSKVTVDVRIPALLIKIQHEELEKMGVSKKDGQQALNGYTRTTAAGDKEAHQRVEDFTHTVYATFTAVARSVTAGDRPDQRTFIEVLRDMEPAEEETEAKLTPAQIMEFFEACDTLLALPETKESLRKEFLETQVPPDETIVGMQRSMLRTLGFSPDHGVACLNAFSKDFPDDEKLQMRLQQFMRCASMARQEAMLGKEELTKRMHVHQATAMKEHKMAMELSALDEAGRADLTKRVSEMQRRHALAVMTLTTQEERLAYIKGIPTEEQWDIAKLKMLTRHLKMAQDGGHDHGHAHGQPGTAAAQGQSGSRDQGS